MRIARPAGAPFAYSSARDVTHGSCDEHSPEEAHIPSLVEHQTGGLWLCCSYSYQLR